MKNTRRKIKKMDVVARVRQSKVDQDSLALVEIRQQKVNKASELKRSQDDYIAWVGKLNSVRASQARENLKVLEDNLDFLKSKWMRLYRELQEIERREKQQIENLAEAHRDLKAVENFGKKLEEQFRREMAASEQKDQDDRAIGRAWNMNSRTS